MGKVNRTPEQKKFCGKCEEILPVSDFYPRGRGKGVQYICKECHNKARRARRDVGDCLSEEQILRIQGQCAELLRAHKLRRASVLRIRREVEGEI